MLNYLHLLCRSLLLCATALLPFGVNAQIFTGELQSNVHAPALEKVLTHWEVYQLDAAQMKQVLLERNYSATLQVQLGAHDWSLSLEPSHILAAGYTLQISSDQGLQTLRSSYQPAFKGRETKQGGPVRLTIDSEFIQGSVWEGNRRYCLEPLRHFQADAERNMFVLYAESDVIPNPDAQCVILASEEAEHFNLDTKTQAVPDAGCYELEIAVASDKSMFNKYGSVAAVQNHNIGVLNDVQGDYTGNFNHDLEFVIVTQFVVTGTDPWTASTDAEALLNSFTAWGNSGNFGTSYDNAELWTNRNFDGGTVGIAWVGGICNNSRYHCIQDFTSNSNTIRQTVTHELGHNFSANHDLGANDCPPNYIMCPFVNGSTTWSPLSITKINSYMQVRINNGCLGPCGSSSPLIADFDWNPDPPCINQTVQFTDQSSGSITTRTWSFPGGTPPTSTATNPSVSWATPGVKNVTLTLGGVGGPASVSKQVTVKGLPTANFTYSYDGLTYTFVSTSTGATEYTWNFGDSQTSNEQDPVHTYNEAGIYTVTLIAQNECGTATKTATINTVPTANFSASPTVGCASFVVPFTNESSNNAASYLWSFPGGQPANSNLTNPVVVYNTSGTYTVTLTAFNTAGSTTYSAISYITVQILPSANYTYAVAGQTVTFTNGTVGTGATYLWNFGDGNTSTLANPTHTYATGGAYTVTLTATNACGSTTSTQTVALIAPPTASFNASTTSGCGPLTVQFASTSAGNPTSYAWAFPGGDPATASTANPLVVYNTPGTYTVSLTVTNAVGSNTATQTNYITVVPPPTAGFTAATNGSTVTFSNTSANASGYSWNFGDGNTSTEQNPEHNYSADGTYTVTLTATGLCGTHTSTQTVVILTPPTAGFTATPTSGCGPLTVQFTNASSANAVSYAWNFPGGNPGSSTLQNPSVVYSAPGTYSVSLVVSNGAGSNTATQSNLVTVNPGPTAGFSSSINGAAVSFTNASANAVSYAWNFGDNTSSTESNPTHTYGADGTYTVTLTATNPCGSATFTQTVVILTPPSAGFTASPSSGCGPLTVQFTNASSANAVSYAWDLPGATPNTSTAPNPSVVYSTPGTYTVTLVVSNAAGSATSTQSNLIVVSAMPVAGFTSTSTGATASFTNTSTNASTFSWNFGDGNTSAAQNPQHTYGADGSYTVTLTASGPCGTSTSSQTITIATPPTPGFTTSATSGCGPLSVQFTNTSSANASTYNWSFPGGTPASSTAANPLVTYDVPGSYTVVLTAGNAAGSNTSTQTNLITVNPDPGAGFTSTTAGATATFTNTSSNATSYNWDFGDGSSSILANPVHTYTADDTYTVVLTATNPCGTATYTQTVVIITSPNAGFTANATSGCGPLTVQFIDLSSDNTTDWEWNFPGGTPTSSTDQNPVVVYDAPGTYDVSLLASTAAGTSMFTQSNFITVLPLPIAGFSSEVAGPTAVFVNSSLNATSYLWDFGDGSTSTQANPTHTYTSDGNFTVTLTATNICGSETTTGSVAAITAPLAGYTPSQTSGCGPLTVQFSNQSSANSASFEWIFEGGTPGTSTEASPSVTWNLPGTYTVTLVATNSAGTNSSSSTITVLSPAAAGFNAQLAGLSVILTNTSTNATAYHWDFGDNTSSTEANPTHNYTLPGSYTITLRAENACGTTEITQTIEIIGAAPIAAFGVSEQKGCAPFTVQYNDLSAGTPTAWLWSFPGGSPASATVQNPSVTYSQPGVYAATLQVTNPYGNNEVTQPSIVEVLDLPSSAFSYLADQTTVSFTNTSQNGDFYSWSFGDNSSSTEANPVHTYGAPGTYTVSLTVVNTCGANTLQQMITLISGAGELAWLEQFRLYPNPSAGIFTVEMQGGSRRELEFWLFNPLGVLLAREKADFSTGTLQRQMDYSHLPAGFYTLQIRSGDSILPVKLAIQR